MLLRRAWRNLWRNPRRTAITMAAIAFSTFILITSFALMVGMIESTVRNATDTFAGEVQVHAPGWLADRSLYKTLAAPRAVLEAARASGLPAAPRLYGVGLAAYGTRSSGALFHGVDPALEAAAFRLATQLEEGSFLGAEARREVLLGRKLARALQAGVGTELVVVVQAADGSMGNELFRVAGVFKSVGESFDRGAAMVHERDFRGLFALEEGVHEVAINGKGALPLEAMAALARGPAAGDEVKNWRELIPMLADMMDLIDASMAIFGAVFLLAAGLGVLNTLLMATFERTRELGLLKALGTTPAGIVAEMAAEAAILALLGTAIGAALGVAAAAWLQGVGIDTTSLAGETTFSGVAFDPIWRARLTWKTVLAPVVSMALTTLLASVIPAVRAARLDPVRAMRHV